MSKNVSLKQSLAIIFTIVASIVICVINEVSLFWGFLGSNVILVSFLIKKGFSPKKIFQASKYGILECSSLYFIILLMGSNIAIWMSSGIIPTIIYYGFSYMQGANYILFSFLGTALISTVMGTGLGTLSTIGIALLGIGKGFGLPPEIILGAIVSGAFVSDKISPVSALTNLTIATVDTTYKEYFKTAIKTLAPMVLICSIIYFIIGSSYSVQLEDSLLLEYKHVLDSAYFISPWLMLLPVLVIGLAVSGINVLKNMSVIFVIGTSITLFVQNTPLYKVYESVFWGYQADTGHSFINSIIKGGGVYPMIEVIGIVAGAIILNALLNLGEILQPLINRFMENTKTKYSLIFKTGVISSVLTTLTCDQTVGIIVPGKMLKNNYEELGMDSTLLARTIADTGTIIAPLEFWNVNSLIIIGLTGIHTFAYAPFAFLCFISPIVTLCFAFAMPKTNKI